MRIPINLSKTEIELIDKIAGQLNISRTEFIRKAIAASLAPHRNKMNHDAFGLWANQPQDGLAYQKQIRAEWKTHHCD